MLDGLGVGPQLSTDTDANWVHSDASGTEVARPSISDAEAMMLHLEEGARFACAAKFFAYGASDGNRTRTVSLGMVTMPA
jgi:hypothetical protein